MRAARGIALVTMGLLLWVGPSRILLGQETPEEQEAVAASEEEQPEEEELLTSAPGLEDIEEILADEEASLAGRGYAYDPGSRRDPFRSLLAPAARAESEVTRPPDIPGLLIDEIVLTGIFRTSEGYLAQVHDAGQNKSYLLREGDQLFDGDVVNINDNEVVFKQIVQDPTALKPFRERVKKLNPEE